MNKKLNFGVSLIIAFFMVFAATAPVFAQTPTPNDGTDPNHQQGWFASLAQALQMGAADLQAALKGGKTIFQLASEKGVDLPGLVTTLTNSLSQRLQQAVTNGSLTQDQADQRLKTLQSGLNDWFTSGTMPPSLKTIAALRNADKTIADDLGMSVKDLNTALKGGKTIAQLAQEKGISLDKLVTDVTAKHTAALKKAVQDGKMTQAQADEALSTLKNNITQWFNTGKNPAAAKIKDALQKDAADLSKQLGMTEDELKQALQSGKTVAQLAQEKGISLDSIVTTLSTQRSNKIQQALQSGKITQDQANQMLDKFKTNLTKRLENGRPHPKNGTKTTPQSAGL